MTEPLQRGPARLRLDGVRGRQQLHVRADLAVPTNHDRRNVQGGQVVVDELLGGFDTTIVAIGGLLAAAIKIPYSWSWDGIFPKWFSTVNDRFRTPHWSLLTMYIAASALLFWTTGLDQAIAIATFSYLIAYFVVSIAAGYLYMKGGVLASRAAYNPGRWFYVTVVVAALGTALLITQAANWPALFSGNFGELSTLAIYFPWLAIGLIVFTIYWYRDRKSGTDVDTVLDTIPGVTTDPLNPVADEN